MSEKKIEINKIYCGDNLEIMREFPDECIDLIYLDPPFFSQKNYEVIWGDDDEVRSFKDRWAGGINNYTEWMVERLKEMYRVLKPTGAIYLHCDWHASHYLKIELDKIFGIENFRNEISVKRIRKNVREHKKVKKLNTAYDSVFFYAKTDKHRILPPLIKDPKPERWHSFDAPELRAGMDYKLFGQKPPEGGHWRWEQSRAEKAIKDGQLRPNKKTGMPEYFIPSSTHSLITSAWYDIKAYSHKHGYPTEKSEELLERIIRMSAEKGDLVLDPFCGCGTATAVAKRLGMNFIGIDISPNACKLISSRVGLSISDLVKTPKTIEELKSLSPHSFQEWVCVKMLAKNTSRSTNKPSGGDGGKDGIIQYDGRTGKYNGAPLQVKQSEGVGINVVKNLFATMHDMKKKNGFIVALSFGSGAVEQVAKYKLEDSVDVKLISAEDLLKVPHYDFNIGYDFGENDDAEWIDKKELKKHQKTLKTPTTHNKTYHSPVNSHPDHSST